MIIMMFETRCSSVISGRITPAKEIILRYPDDVNSARYIITNITVSYFSEISDTSAEDLIKLTGLQRVLLRI